MSEIVETLCTQCSKPLLRNAREIRRQLKRNPEYQVFCSVSCSGVYHTVTQLINCTECSRQFKQKVRTQEFCSQSCSASYSNKHRRRSHRAFDCVECGKAIPNPHYKTVQSYCSSRCGSTFKFKNWISRWLTNDPELVTVSGVAFSPSPYIKRYLIETRGNRCEVCGWNEIHPITGNVPIQMDHVDGNVLNNRPENLKLLCPNHHSLTSTYGSLNKHSGRASRRKSYLTAAKSSDILSEV